MTTELSRRILHRAVELHESRAATSVQHGIILAAAEQYTAIDAAKQLAQQACERFEAAQQSRVANG